MSLPGLGTSFHQLCSAQFSSWENSLGTALAPSPLEPQQELGTGSAQAFCHLSVLQPDSSLCLPASSGINWLGVTAPCPVPGLAAEPGLQLAGKGGCWLRTARS